MTRHLEKDQKKTIKKRRQLEIGRKEKGGPPASHQPNGVQGDFMLLQGSLGNQVVNNLLRTENAGVRSSQSKTSGFSSLDLSQIANRPISANAQPNSGLHIQREPSGASLFMEVQVNGRRALQNKQTGQIWLMDNPSAPQAVAASPAAPTQQQPPQQQQQGRRERPTAQQVYGGVTGVQGHQSDIREMGQQAAGIASGNVAGQSRSEAVAEGVGGATGDVQAIVSTSSSLKERLKTIMSMSLNLWNDGLFATLEGVLDSFLNIIGLGHIKDTYSNVLAAKGAKYDHQVLQAASQSQDQRVRMIAQYGDGKVLRRYYESVLKAVLSGCRAAMRIITFVTGGAAAIITESINLAAALIEKVGTLYHEVKGFYKWMVNSKGKNRQENATQLVNLAMQGSPDAQRLVKNLTGAAVFDPASKQTLIAQVAEKLKSTG
ncbi:MAG: hypothetical protein AAF633_00370 [Chloroflexota bacterium]